MQCRDSRFAARMALVLAVILSTGRHVLAADVVQPFNGKDLAGWKFRGSADQSKWAVGTAKLSNGNLREMEMVSGGAEMVNLARSVDIYTGKDFGDCSIELEVMVPKGSNSGIYLMGNYEIQVADSFGKKNVGVGGMGAIYGQTAPSVNASKAPGTWQKYVIDFRAPKFDSSGKKIANAKVIKCTLNDKVIHEDVEITGCTGGAMSNESPTGPLRFQGDHGPIAYRNIRITAR
jgi:hypothetical protein